MFCFFGGEGSPPHEAAMGLCLPLNNDITIVGSTALCVWCVVVVGVGVGVVVFSNMS